MVGDMCHVVIVVVVELVAVGNVMSGECKLRFGCMISRLAFTAQVWLSCDQTGEILQSLDQLRLTEPE